RRRRLRPVVRAGPAGRPGACVGGGRSGGEVAMNKVYASVEAAVADIPDGATIMVGGFGSAGVPEALVRAPAAHPVRDLVLVSNGTGEGESGLVHLIRNRQVRRVLTSFPAPGRSPDFEAQYSAGELEMELVPQGTLAERIRAGGAGVAAFYT